MYKRLGKYNQIINLKSFEAIAYLKTKFGENKIFEMVINLTVPDWCLMCPLTSQDFQLNKLSYTPVPVNIWPDGCYKITVTFSDDVDEKIYSLSYVLKNSNTGNIQEFK